MSNDLIGNYLHRKVYRRTMGADTQTIPARHATATFVPAGSTIKIINTSGTQIIDTWAFALPSPPSKDDDSKQQNNAQPNGKPEEPTEQAEEQKSRAEESKQKAEEPKQKTDESKQDSPKSTPKRTKSKKGGLDLPSQEEAELATSQGIQATNGKQNATPGKKGWSAYIPSVNLRGNKSDAEKNQIKENSRNWGKYFSAGQGFGNYIPSKQTISAFATSHYRDSNKPYIQQLSDFARTPVGAAGISALSGQGYTSSLYAGYSAWTGGREDAPPTMEFLSMAHTRAANYHLTPKLNDVLVSNLREPMLTVLEDTSGVHDTLISACDPSRYRQLGVEKWSEHGSCAENLVLALKELNERAGLKGPKGIGADITVNTVPPPLNLFMNVPWTPQGDLNFEPSKAKKGDYVRFRAERDVVVVMSACPFDVKVIKPEHVQDAHFVVEEELDPASEDIRKRLQASSPEKQKKAVPAKRPARKLNAGGKKPAKAGHTAIGTTKTPKSSAPSEEKEKASSSRPAPQRAQSTSTPSTPARQPQEQQQQQHQQRQPPTPLRRQSSSQVTRRDSVSTVPSNTKHAGAPDSRRTSQATTAGPQRNADNAGDEAADTAAQPQSQSEGQGQSQSQAPAPASAAPAERKKPRKIQRRTPAAA
ncbi:hypothetical protein K461DRAFT_239195 [Myriangium duriaei CBS 260.36]|uniref:DUF1989 domain-containing protein n=1 Tax=Myriangium duriaei CBS 260.36 TaxID=1168546 RepID=A0A9P4J3H6_9PEZI|nr:hypothetical protein K461DRAFT_239195 [Myriangium duriaei CBS 260.36]